MKRCPECRRDYYDNSLLYCLDDGSALLEAHGVTDEPLTAIFTASPLGNVAGPIETSPRSIAVLPFVNVSRNEDAEYFSDGLADELLNVLSKINGLRVAGRTSAFSFKGKQTTVAEIGRQLNVASVLEGSVRMAGQRMRISVQLVNVADGYHRWSQTYDRTMDDIFAVQDDIANSVVEELRSQLASNHADHRTRAAVDVAGAARGRADDPEVHRLMLLGRHFAERGTPEDLVRAVECFEQGLKIDPQNARCFLEIGIAHVLRASYSINDYAEAYEKARAAAENALSLDPELAVGHALLARVKLRQSLDLRGAEACVARAREVEPENVFVLLTIAYVVRALGQFEKSAESARKVLILDPLNAGALESVGRSAYLLGQLDEAENALKRAIELAPKAASRHGLLSLILAEKGIIDEARIEAERETVRPWSLWASALVEAAAGRIHESNKALNSLLIEYAEDCAFQIAEIYASRGEGDNAFEHLHVAVENHDPGASDILISPQLRPLHSDPRWRPLLRSIGLPEEYWPGR
jgi:adenylate cyclase